MGLAKQWLIKIEEITNQILVFGEKGKLEKLSEESREATNSVHMCDGGQEIKSGPYRWKASALTTKTTLLSKS